MGKEIERKFMVKEQALPDLGAGTRLRQGYLSLAKTTTVRVRSDGARGYLTVKGMARGAARPEYEYEIPVSDAEEMLASLCEQPLIEKTRYRISFAGLTWEVDRFAAENAGLIVAEVELSDEAQPIALPEWIGREVTGDPRFFNANLVRHPFTEWQDRV